MLNILDYKERLKAEILDTIEKPITEHSADIVSNLIECYENVIKFEEMAKDNENITYDDAENWNEHMENADGTTGGHWSISQTNDLAKELGVKFEHITDWMFNVTVNMMYSDYFNVARKYDTNNANFYGDMAKAFLFDKDGGKPKEKLTEYYKNIVCEKPYNHNYNKPEKEKLTYDILPSYAEYKKTKMQYQLGEIDKDIVLEHFDYLSREIKDFMQQMYDCLNSPEERERYKYMIQDINRIS